MNMNIKLEQLQKAIDDALEVLQKADAARDANAAYNAAADCYKAMKELKAYKMEHKL